MHTMSNFSTLAEETSSILVNSAVVRHEIEKKQLRTVGNVNSNSVQLSTTTTNTKISVFRRKSGVSSVSMSLERKDSIQYIPRDSPSCVITGGQNTVIHIDNYTNVMAQRVTAKTIKRARSEITVGSNNSIVPWPTNTPKSSNLVDGTVDVNLNILGAVDSSYSSNNKALNMNKQKLRELKSSVKVRGRKNSLADYKSSQDGNKLIESKMSKQDTAKLKKPVNRRKNVIKAIKARTPKIKLKTAVKQMMNSDEERDQMPESGITPTEGETKILRPCVYTMQNKKCLSEVKCLYLHSDFPCKYYYLNMPCPKGLSCQFMHNGNLEPELEEALRNHILELMSPNPSTVETYFVEQMNCIEDLSRRLQSLQNNQTNNEVIEVVDDGDEDLIVVEESSNDYDTRNVDDDMTNPQPTINDLDVIYASIKETNSTVDEIGIKLKKLKSRKNIMPNEKMQELQKIYSLLKEQEKRLKLYGKLNTTTTSAEITTNDVNKQTHVLLVNPSIVNDIRSSENLTDDENIMTTAERVTKSQAPNVVGTEFLITAEENVINLSDDENTESKIEHQCSEAKNSNATKQVSIEVITNENLPQPDSSDNKEIVNLSKENAINNLNVSANVEEIITSDESVPNNSNLNLNENFEKSEINNKDTQILNEERVENIKFHIKQPECNDFQQMTEEILENHNSSLNFDDKNVNSILHKESHELEITNNEKKVIKNTTKEDHIESEEVQEKSSHEFGKRCLRSHAMQDNEETSNQIGGKKSTSKTPERVKPYRTRRLRLPKPSKKTPEKPNLDECENKVFDKLIKPTQDNSAEKKLLQNVEAPLTQNVILSKRFIKRLKPKLEQQSLVQEMKATSSNNRVAINVERKLSELHNEDTESLNKIENNDVSNSLNISQYHLKVAANIPTSIDHFNSLKLQLDSEKSGTITNSNLNRRISFEMPTSSVVVLSSSHIKDKFNLGNPQVVLTKLKIPFNHQTTQKHILADSTTSHVNAIVTSSTPLADEKSKQKRRILTDEHDLDSSPGENKCLRIENSKPVRKVKIDERKRTFSQQSYDSKGEDFENDSSDEKLTMELSYNSNEQEETIESCSTSEQQQHYTHQYEHKEQEENESDLRQQIENISNKSDLQLQTQYQEQQRFQKQKEVEETSISTSTKTAAATATSLIGKNNKTLPHIHYQEQERVLDVEKRDTKDLLQRHQYEENETEDGEITNASNSCDSIEKYEDERAQSLTFAGRIDKPEKQSSNSSTKYSNETCALEQEEGNIGYSTFSSLSNKLTNHSVKRQITFEKSAVNITPISSPTYDTDTIASPSPVRKFNNFRMGGEVDGRLTYPPMPYIIREIDLGKIEVNKPQFIDKLKKTIQLDPRIFKTHKKPFTILGKSAETTSNALLQNITSNTFNFTSSHQPPSSLTQATASIISPFDPRNRTSATMTDIATSALSQETAIAVYNSRQPAAAASSTSLSSSLYNTQLPNSVPLALQYGGAPQSIIQPQQQQTLNIFLYSCLQRSSWYQSLMSTMKIQINQSISQLVRALNSFHRERVFNPELIFDIFKLDCAGEVLEIMRNLGIFVDANGVINEQRHVPSPSVHTCCNEMPVNTAYSFIQQFLTPNAHCPAPTTASSSCTAAGAAVGQLHANEPILSCYVRAPEPVQKHSDECVPANQPQQDCNNCNKCNNNRNDNNYNNNNYNNNQNNNRRYVNHFKKPYDNSTNNNNNNNNNGNNSHQQRSNHRSSYNNNYNNNPRFMKPGSNSPKRFNSSPTSSPRKSYDGGSGGGFGGAGGRGDGGRFNNNRRFKNYNNNDNNNDNGGSSSGAFSSYKENSYNTEPKTSSPTPENSLVKSSKPTSTDEECWDSDN